MEKETRDIKNKLERYFVGDIDRDELKSLRTSISTMENSELEDILMDMWIEYEEGTSYKGDFDELVRKLQIVIPQEKKRYPKFQLAKAAAVLLIPILIGFQIYLFRSNQKLNSFIEKNVVVDVKSGEKTDLVLPDGSKVVINAGSSLTYPINFGFEKRTVNIVGEAYFEVVKNSKPFIVNMQHIQIEVLGTHFNICSNSTLNSIETTLLEGSIKLTTKSKNPRSVLISPQEKAVYYIEKDIISVSKTDTYGETAWLRGELVFRSVGFLEIVRTLEKRYGIKIEIESNKYDKGLFSGSFKEDYVFGILKILQTHYNFTYENIGDKIVIQFK